MKPRRRSSLVLAAALVEFVSTVSSAAVPAGGIFDRLGSRSCPATNPDGTTPRLPPAFATRAPASSRWRRDPRGRPGRASLPKNGNLINGIGPDVPRGGGTLTTLSSSWHSVTPDQARRVASKLYPMSIIPIAIQNYLWTRPETCCPRGAAVGSIAQTLAILLGVPIVAVSTKLAGGDVPFIEMDWLHGIEQLLMAVPVHVMAQSFRQAVLSLESERALPKSATSYGPMVKVVAILFPLIFLLGYIHVAVAGQAWTDLRFLGGLAEVPMPGLSAERLKGALSFAVWIPHWTMFIDFATQLRYMHRWGDCIGVQEWKALALLHLPYAVVNAMIALNHLNRDQIPALKLLHPIFVFGGSLAILLGTVLVAQSNGWAVWWNDKKQANDENQILLDDEKFEPIGPGAPRFPDWDLRYTAKTIVLASIISYMSLYFTR